MLYCQSQGFIAFTCFYEDINFLKVFFLEYSEAFSEISSYQSNTLHLLEMSSTVLFHLILRSLFILHELYKYFLGVFKLICI